MPKKKIDILLIIFSMIISMISLFYLPDTIPVNYDELGNVSRYGSKYELSLLLPVVMILMCLIITFIEYTLLAIHLRAVTEFFKTLSILIFSFENIKKILKPFDVNITCYVSMILWIVLTCIAYELNFKKNINWFLKERLTKDK